MKILLQMLFCVFFLHGASMAQTGSRDYNLDFKKLDGRIPQGWRIEGTEGYDIGVDSSQLLLGKPSLKIKSTTQSNAGYGMLAFDIPENLRGESLVVYAQVKTEQVAEDAYIGLFGAVTPEVDEQNMEDKKINGTRDWADQMIWLTLSPEETKKITIGLYLVGEGTVWFNDVQLFVDYESYVDAPVYELTADSIYRYQSHVPAFEPTAHNFQVLKEVGLVWGLVKYSHPAVASGNWNMDVALFQFLPKLMQAQSQAQRERLFIKWINHFGEIPEAIAASAEAENKLVVQADHQWIDAMSYSDRLKSLLHRLTEVPPPDKHKYVSYFEGPNHPKFNELSYVTADVDDLGFRLLGLFRYWNCVQYFFPYRDLIDRPWTTVLDDFVPLFYHANATAAIDSAYLKLFSTIGDSHGFAVLADTNHADVFGKNGLGLKLKIVGDKVVVAELGLDSIGKEAGLLVGDLITGIDDVSVQDLIRAKRPLVAASNEHAAMRDVAGLLLRTDDDEIKVNLLRDSNAHTVVLRTTALSAIPSMQEEQKEAFFVLDNRLLYLHGGLFKEDAVEAFVKAMPGKEGVIIDLRPYPIATLHELLSAHLFPQENPFTNMTSNKGLRPGEFAIDETISVGKSNPDCFSGRVVILIDEGSQSASEFQTMAFQTIPGATVVGRNSAGADGNISWIPLPLGFKTAFSGLGVYYPGMTQTQRIGIVPDIYVDLRIEDVSIRKDRILETALRLF